MKFESAPNIPKSHKTNAREPRAQVEHGEAKEKERGAMCASLMKSAKRIATLGAFIGSANGIAGCATFEGARRASEIPSVDPEFPSVQQMLDELDEKTPTSAEFLAYQGRRREALQRPEQETMGKTEFNGFESIGVDSKLFQQFAETAMPKKWLRKGDVSSVRMEPKFIPMPYPGFENKPEFGHCKVNSDGSPSEIVITSERFKGKDIEGDTDHLFEDTLFHEFAHANDWKSSPDLTPKEALELRYLILHAVESTGRPKFAYPESIHAPSPSKAEVEDRMNEYFAELVADALSFRKDGTGEPPTWETWESNFAEQLRVELQADAEQSVQNAHIMRWYFSHVEAEFKPWEAAAKADALSGPLVSKLRLSGLEKAMQKISDPSLKQALVQLLKQPKESFTAKDLALQREVEMNPNPAAKPGLEVLSHVSEKAYGSLHDVQEMPLLMEWTSSVRNAMKVRHAAWMGERVSRNGQNILDQLTEFSKIWHQLPPTRQEALRPQLLAYAQATMEIHAPAEKLRTKK